MLSVPAVLETLVPGDKILSQDRPIVQYKHRALRTKDRFDF